MGPEKKECERKGRKRGRAKKSVERRGQCPCPGCPQPPQACWGPGGSPSWRHAPQPRLSPGQGWLHNGGGRRPAGCHVGAGVGAAPRRGFGSSPEARAFPDALAAVKGAGSCQQQGSGRGPPAAGWPDGCNMRSGDRAGGTQECLRPLLEVVQDPFPWPGLPPTLQGYALDLGSQQHPKSCSLLGGGILDQVLHPNCPQLLGS